MVKKVMTALGQAAGNALVLLGIVVFFSLAADALQQELPNSGETIGLLATSLAALYGGQRLLQATASSQTPEPLPEPLPADETLESLAAKLASGSKAGRRHFWISNGVTVVMTLLGLWIGTKMGSSC